jgi:hypothetical protein
MPAQMVRILTAIFLAFVVGFLATIIPNWANGPIAAAAALLLALGVLFMLWLAVRVPRFKRRETPCDTIPARFWKRPDPYIYDQTYLSGLGLEITWDNPDIWFELAGVRISDNLLPGTRYDVVAAIHNASVEAPAFNTMVEFFSQDYGAGAQPVYIDAVSVPVVPIQGNPPAIARTRWTTPTVGGHFCIVVRLTPVDDSNPFNNEGQKNVRVVAVAPGQERIELALPIFNSGHEALTLSVRASGYALPRIDEEPRTVTLSRLRSLSVLWGANPEPVLTDAAARRLLVGPTKNVVAASARGRFEVAPAWQLQLPDDVVIEPSEVRSIVIPVALPSGSSPGTYPITLNAFRPNGTLYGGVTELVRTAPGSLETQSVTTTGSPGRGPIVQGGGDKPGDGRDIHRTRCVRPRDRDHFLGGAGQGPAVFRAAFFMMVGIVAQVLLAGPAGTAIDVFLFLFGVNQYLDWWLNRRLLCLGDACAIGIIWSVERPRDKFPKPEWFDDDYSINLLLSPAKPGDGPDQFKQQAHLVRAHAEILAEGLPTFGSDRVATTADSPPLIVTRGPADDPNNPDEVAIQLGLGRTSWENFGEGLISIQDTNSVPGTTLWNADPDADPKYGDQRPSAVLPKLPHTQLLHCEFEGTTLSNIQPVVLVAGALAGTILVTETSAIAAGGAAAVAAAIFWFLFLLALLAILTRLLSGHGDPEDAGLPDSDIERVATDDGNMANPDEWDKRFTVVAVRGRFVYDYGHSRGWNEIHPVNSIVKITDSNMEADLLARGLPHIRPLTETELRPLIDEHCNDLVPWHRPNEPGTSLVALHPSLPRSHVKIVTA